jgi:shikimate dehydrogenase
MRAAVLGSPIEHSLSPALHRAAYAEMGLDWTYDAIEVTEETLPDFIAQLDDTWAGLSLTMPLKESVMPLLQVVSPDAAAVRSVNTVIPLGSGWQGHNTDIHGVVAAIQGTGCSHPRTATVLGAGATARSAIAALARIGVVQVTVCARRADAGDDLARVADAFGMDAEIRDFTPNAEAMKADVVICTVPGDAGASWIPAAAAGGGALLDVSYHPWPSPLASVWNGMGVASGRDMLLWQAVEQVRLMTGRSAPVGAMRAALPAP